MLAGGASELRTAVVGMYQVERAQLLHTLALAEIKQND